MIPVHRPPSTEFSAMRRDAPMLGNPTQWIACGAVKSLFPLNAVKYAVMNLAILHTMVLKSNSNIPSGARGSGAV